jgi:hypothetical protein
MAPASSGAGNDVTGQGAMRCYQGPKRLLATVTRIDINNIYVRLRPGSHADVGIWIICPPLSNNSWIVSSVMNAILGERMFPGACAGTPTASACAVTNRVERYDLPTDPGVCECDFSLLT